MWIFQNVRFFLNGNLLFVYNGYLWNILEKGMALLLLCSLEFI